MSRRLKRGFRLNAGTRMLLSLPTPLQPACLRDSDARSSVCATSRSRLHRLTQNPRYTYTRRYIRDSRRTSLRSLRCNPARRRSRRNHGHPDTRHRSNPGCRTLRNRGRNLRPQPLARYRGCRLDPRCDAPASHSGTRRENRCSRADRSQRRSSHNRTFR